MAIADPLEETTPSALPELEASAVRIVMLTGENDTTAQAIDRKLDIRDVESDVLPDQKAGVVARLRSEGAVVAMA